MRDWADLADPENRLNKPDSPENPEPWTGDLGRFILEPKPSPHALNELEEALRPALGRISHAEWHVNMCSWNRCTPPRRLRRALGP